MTKPESPTDGPGPTPGDPGPSSNRVPGPEVGRLDARRRERRAVPWWVWLIAVVAVGIAIAAINPGGFPRPGGPGSETAAASSAASSVEPVTPSPTGTQHDTDRAAFAAEFGDFKPLSKSGSAAAVIDLPKGAKSGLLTVQYQGSEPFAVNGLDDEGRPLAVSPYVASPGPWNGTLMFGFWRDGEIPAKIQVRAKSRWTLKVAPVHTAPELTVPASGAGFGVFLVRGGDSEWTVGRQGPGEFRLWAHYPPEEWRLLVVKLAVPDKIDNFETTTQPPERPSIIRVEGRGDWFIRQS